tara:strand:+ start:20314 stop:20499 length:186 start_codon:yes stop_codon:yes gene_type:complete
MKKEIQLTLVVDDDLETGPEDLRLITCMILGILEDRMEEHVSGSRNDPVEKALLISLLVSG